MKTLRWCCWLLVVAFVLPVPVVRAAEGAAYKVVLMHPVVGIVNGQASPGMMWLYLLPLLLGLAVLFTCRRRPAIAAALGLLPLLALPLVHPQGNDLLQTARAHSLWWLPAALGLMWVGTRAMRNKSLDRRLLLAALGGFALLAAWLFVPGFNRQLPDVALFRLPFGLVRQGAGAGRILGLGLLLAEVSWLLAGLQSLLEALGVGAFSRTDRRGTMLLGFVFVLAGVFFSELVTAILLANHAPAMQGWALVTRVFGRLKTWLTFGPLLLLPPLAWDNWIATHHILVRRSKR